MMGRMVYAQWLKSKGTWLVPFCLVLPVCYGFLVAAYLSLSGREEITPLILVNVCLIFHIAIQFCSAVWIAAHVELDREAGQFANECRWQQHRKRTILAKLSAYGLLLGIIAFLVGGSLLAFSQLFKIGFPAAFLPHSALLLGVGTYLMLPLLPVYLWTAYAFHRSGTLLVSAFFVLTGVLFGTTGLGYGLWRILPMSWGLKWLSPYGTDTSVPLTMPVSLMAAAFCLVVCLVWLLMGWFSRWDGYSRWDA